MIRLTAVVLYN